MSWSIRVYMAGDNDLDGNALRDLIEMQQAPGVDDLDVLVQLDRKHQYIPHADKWEEGRRFRIRACPDSLLLCAEELGRLGEINTGDPMMLVEFISWAASFPPKSKACLILWGHGTGWKPGPGGRADAGGRGRLFEPKAALSLLGLTQSDISDAVVGRFIALDDQAGDALEAVELTMALERAGKVWDLLAFDACSMMELELLYMLAPYATWICGSQAIEPKDGWPYREVLSDLAASQEWDGSELGIAAVRRFAEAYAGQEHTVYSLVRTAPLQALSEALSALGDELASNMDAMISSVTDTRRLCLVFQEKDYVDIGDFLDLLASKPNAAPHLARIGAARDALIAVVSACKFSEDPRRALRGTGRRGIGSAKGLSIYLPFQYPDFAVWVVYNSLPFHRDYPGWLKFIVKFLNA